MLTVYNNANIQAWINEVRYLTAQKGQNQAIIAENNHALIPLQTELQLLNSQISSVQVQLAYYQIRNTQDAIYHCGDHRHHRHTRGFLHTAVDVISTVQLVRLQIQLSDLESQARTIERQIHPHLKLIKDSNLFIAQTDSRLSWLNFHINNAPIFLNTLRTNPLELVNELKRKITESLQDFDDNNSQGLSPQVRIALFNLAEKPAYLTLSPEHMTLNNVQRNYLHLCTLLQHMKSKVFAEAENKAFTERLDSLLAETYIGTDLPDELETYQNTADHNQFLQNLNPDLFCISPERLIILEEERFQSWFNHLQHRSAPCNALEQKINNTLNLLNEEIGIKKLKNEVIDYHFYNRVLADLSKISANPRDTKAIQHLSILANVASGNPSLGKKIAGALLALAGIALMDTSIACLVLTSGGSSFASSFGLALGLKFSLGITLGAGAGLGFFGLEQFKEGERKGLSKTLDSIQTEATRSNCP